MKILFFDLETSGLDIYNDRIIEYGAVVYENQNLVREEDEFVDIDFPLSKEIIELTHITDEMLRNGKSEIELFYLIDSMIDEDTVLAAYNIQFDINFLITLFQKYKNPNYEFKNNIIDVLAIYKDRQYYPHRLKDAILKYNCEGHNSHRAIDDAKATALLFQKMALECDNMEKYINVVGYNKEYGIIGRRLNHVLYVTQKGGQREIEKL